MSNGLYGRSSHPEVSGLADQAGEALANAASGFAFQTKKVKRGRRLIESVRASGRCSHALAAKYLDATARTSPNGDPIALRTVPERLPWQSRYRTERLMTNFFRYLSKRRVIAMALESFVAPAQPSTPNAFTAPPIPANIEAPDGNRLAQAARFSWKTP